MVGQETYGLAIVCLGEALYSFFQYPSLGNVPKHLLPGVLSAVVLALVAGPMVTSHDLSSVETGLQVATLVSVLLGSSYIIRMVLPYSDIAKEIAFGGLLVASAGFFSYSQNLVANGFVRLPALPAIPFPTNVFDFYGISM